MATIVVGCPADARGDCRNARIRLVSGTRKIGTSRAFSVRRGQQAKVKVKWNKAAQRVLRKRKSMRVQITGDAFDDRNVRGTNTRRITVRPSSAKAPSSRPR